MAVVEIDLSKATGSGYMTIDGSFSEKAPATEGKTAGRVIANTNGYTYNATSLESGQSVSFGKSSSDAWIINMGTQASTVDASKVTGGGKITATGAASIKGGESFEIHTGSGKDNIEAASYDTVYAGAGDDTVSFSGDYAYVNLGDGLNTVAAGKGNYATIIGGKDADSVKSAGQYVSITLGEGANYASVSGNDATITSGAGKDTVELAKAAKYAFVNTGAGNDSIVSAADDATIYAGAGDDVATLSGDDWTLDMGAGDDSVNLSNNGTVTLGAGKDTVTLGATADVTVADYTLADDLIQGAAPTDLAKSFLTDGMVSLAANQKITVNTTNGVYAAKIGADKDSAQTYVWAAETGAFINGNLFKGGSNALTMIGNNNGDTADTLIGGTGNDTIYAGEGDVVYGGTGADSIVLSTAAATVGLGNKGGADTVTNFAPEKHVILAMDTVATGLTFSQDGNDLVVSSGKNGSLKLSGVELDGTDGKKSKMLTVQNGLAGNTVQVEVLKADDALNADAAFVSAVGTDSVGVRFADDGKDTVIDLANTTVFGDTRTYRNINAATISGSGADTLIGSRGADTLVASGTEGNVTIFGGAGNDSLVDDGAQGDVTFLYAASNGLDTIHGYTHTADKKDVLSFYNDSVQSYTRVERDDAGIVFTFGDAKQKLTVQTADAVDTSVAIQKNYGDVEYAKFGKSTVAATFTYESNVSLYYGGKGQDNKLTISSADDATIALYDSDKFVNIKKVDASASTGELVLIGSADNDVLTAGSGVATLFGGKGNDTLNGGYGQTTFYFDKAGGKDVINSLNASDKVMLYDTSLSDLESNKVTADGNLVFKLKNGSQLTVNNISDSTAHVFQFSDGSQYQYNGTTDNGKINWQQIQ